MGRFNSDRGILAPSAIAKQYRYLDLLDILVLDIPDEYQYMLAELVDTIRTSTEAILNNCLN